MKKIIFDLSVYVMITFVCVCVSLMITNLLDINTTNKVFMNCLNAFIFFMLFVAFYVPTLIKVYDFLND